MSRRRGEFEHRTSIFEGAFRAWSHLGGLKPEDIETKSAADLDPLTNPIEDDERMATTRKEDGYSGNDTSRRLYPYEPLPRAGLAHPYVQAILSPWLGPDADHDAIQLGLTTLRTWWQHRRKGESGSAVAALGTDRMTGVVEGYTRHFFNLAHCLVVSDKEQPPRSLNSKMKELEKARSKRIRKRAREEEAGKLAALAVDAGMKHGFTPQDGATPPLAAASDHSDGSPVDEHLSPLERLHASQRRQLAENGGMHSTIPGMGNDINSFQLIHIKGKCLPGTVDLPKIVDKVNHQSLQLAHRGVSNTTPTNVTSGSSFGGLDLSSGDYGDPNTTPVVFVSENGDIQIAVSVDGITCAHCVKIVETVLKGCNGRKSPIEGLLDAAADRVLCQVLLKIDKSSNAKRIAFEAARNLAMVGYTAKVKEMSIVNAGGDKKATMDLGALSTAFEVVANTDPKDVFDWNIPCSCPDNGILRDDCARHSQMNTRIFESFETREQQVTEFMAGCGQKYGMPCTCGPDCRCRNCSGEHCGKNMQAQKQQLGQGNSEMHDSMHDSMAVGDGVHMHPFPMNHDNFPHQMAPSNLYYGNMYHPSIPEGHAMPMAHRNSSILSRDAMQIASRNTSFVSFGGSLRHASITSETTFGRAMSGLSALSIDWENMDDFDVNVDHSEHINNGINHAGPSRIQTDGVASSCAMMSGGECNCGPGCLCAGCPVHEALLPLPYVNNGRRSSLRRNLPGDPDGHAGMQVSFKV